MVNLNDSYVTNVPLSQMNNIVFLLTLLIHNVTISRKLLEGEETRFSTSGISIMPPNHSQSYSYQPRIHSSSSSRGTPAASKKDEADSASKTIPKSSARKGETYEEIIEETVVSTKIIEKPEQNEGINGKS